jgi:hypothetical protein
MPSAFATRQTILLDRETMPILRDVPIALTAMDVLALQGKGQPRPALLRDAEEAIALGKTLWQPRAVYAWFDVRSVDGEQLHLANGDPSPGLNPPAPLHVGAKSYLLNPAEQVLVAVCTIGPALEQRVHDLQREREGLKAYLLDSAGVVALGAVGEAIRCIAEEAAAERGWGVSAALSPGSLVGWPLQGQRELCALLPLEQIGVRLNAGCVLAPHKSVSTLIGLGPGYDSGHVGSVCKFCALASTCWRRREDSA